MISIEELYSLYKKHPFVTTDSRDCPEGSIFIALKGENFNGNTFAPQAIGKGCAYAIVQEPEYADGKRIFCVEDTLKCLQELARHHRKMMRKPVIGITGTNGKTTTKELTANVLMKKYKVLYTQGNLNNHIGVPLTLLKLREDHDMAIIEMGANHPGEIKTLVNIAQPDFGIITNVGKAHLQGFGSFEGVIRTKGELYDYLRTHSGKAFINAANPHLCSILQGLDAIPYASSDEIFFDGKEDFDCVTATESDSRPFLRLRWAIRSLKSDGANIGMPFHLSKMTGKIEEKESVQTQLIGSYNLENALAAIRVGLYFGLEDQDIADALRDYCPGNNRSQLNETGRNHLIIDAYNANPTSMTAAIENFLLLPGTEKAVILGKMGELGAYSQEEHRKILRLLKEGKIAQALLIGEEFLPFREDVSLAGGYLFFSSAEECREYLLRHPLEGCTLLLKGSRSNRLEQLIECL